MAFDHVVTDVAQLRQRYREPAPLVVKKVIDHLDEGARSFLAAATFAAVGTRGPGGADVSPRGGPPGFLVALDEHRLALGDLSGNNRLDTFANVLTDPAVGLLVLVPGIEETLRVNGRGVLTTDPAVLDACAVDGRTPGVALGVEVLECYVHCAKALRRGGLWEPESWPAADDRPRPAAIIREHVELGDVPTEVIEADLEAGYGLTMWLPGGRAERPDGGAPGATS